MANTLLTSVTETATVSYNGYSFPVERQYSIQWEDVYDDADRKVIAKRGLLTITAVVTAALPSVLKTTVTNIDCVLSKPGKTLAITNTGLTDISIANGDLKWGPKPRKLSWTPLGGNCAAEFTWECEIYVDPCCGGALQRLMALNMTATYSADYRGLIKRTLRGYLQTYQRSIDAGSISYPVDQLWAANHPPVPKKFQRMGVERTISNDNTRLDFVIADEEIEAPNGLPPGIVKASMPIFIRNAKPQSFKSWNIQVSGSFEVAPNYPLDWGFRRWILMVADYTAHWSNNRTGDVQTNYASIITDPDSAVPLAPLMLGGTSDGKTTLLMNSLSWGRDVFTRASEFEASFLLIRDLSSLVSGIWSKVPGVDFDQWQTSMAATWASYGGSNIQDNASRDVLVTMCSSPSSQGKPAVASSESSGGDENTDVDNSGITYGTSWQEYENRIESTSKQYYNYHSVSQNYLPSVASSGANNPHFASGGSGALINSAPNVSSVQANIIEYNGSPQVTVTMAGYAKRVKWQPEIPQLLSVGQAIPREVNRWTSGMKEVGQCGDAKIYWIAWRITYMIDSAGVNDLRVPAPPNVFSS